MLNCEDVLGIGDFVFWLGWVVWMHCMNVWNLEMFERLCCSVVNCGVSFLIFFFCCFASVFLLMCLHFLLTCCRDFGMCIVQ